MEEAAARSGVREAGHAAGGWEGVGGGGVEGGVESMGAAWAVGPPGHMGRMVMDRALHVRAPLRSRLPRVVGFIRPRIGPGIRPGI